MGKWFKKIINKEPEENLLDENFKLSDKNENMNFLDRLRNGLSKTRKELSHKVDNLLMAYKKIDSDLFEDLEDILIGADIGVETSLKLVDQVKDKVKREGIEDAESIKSILKEEIRNLMRKSVESNELELEPGPALILVVGVNGVGKTTTIGKLAHRFKLANKKVLIAAGDTYRAAAIEQLEEWSKRSSSDFISHKEGSDPSAVIYDAIHAAKARKIDILICDTAGRLHNKVNLMNELEKIVRVIDKEFPEAKNEILLVLDATTGQNALNQAKVFKEVANITGIALTKLDGTAKGGVVIALQSELGLSVKLVGVGEGLDDLQIFSPDDFIDSILE